LSLRSAPLEIFRVHCQNAAPDAGRSAATGLAAFSFRQNLSLRSTPLQILRVHYQNAAPDAGRSARKSASWPLLFRQNLLLSSSSATDFYVRI